MFLILINFLKGAFNNTTMSNTIAPLDMGYPEPDAVDSDSIAMFDGPVVMYPEPDAQRLAELRVVWNNYKIQSGRVLFRQPNDIDSGVEYAIQSGGKTFPCSCGCPKCTSKFVIQTGSIVGFTNICLHDGDAGHMILQEFLMKGQQLAKEN